MSELSSKGQKRKLGDLGARLLTAAVVVPILLALLFVAPKWGFLILVFAATVVGAGELFGMVTPGRRLLQVWGILASLGVLSMLVFEPAWLTPGTALVALVVIGFVISLAEPDPIESAGGRMAWVVAGPLYIGALLATIALLHQRENGGEWVVLAMMLSWFADTGAYFAGRAFGKHKLYEKVSPKKTIEGAAGGVVGSVVGVLLAHFWYLPELPLVGGIGLAVVASVLGQAGDLVESLIKRSTGVKDSGWIVPGHGGLLDRIDALMITAAVSWVFATLLLDPGHL